MDILWVQILLGAVLIGVTTHILSFRTMKSSEILRIRRVRTQAEIDATASLAEEIWRECYQGIVPVDQIEYMLREIQSSDAIAAQMLEGYEYYHLRAMGRNCGYIAIKQGDDGRLFLSKIYILKEFRGRGYAREALDFITNYCRRHQLGSVWLTVNKENKNAIDSYLKCGFQKSGEKVTNIGSGYRMDDYLMEKPIT